MLIHYIKTAIRHLTRHKTYSGINILGLAMGIAFCLLTFLFVRHEWTYDQFHTHSDRTYRVINSIEADGETHVISILPETLGPLLKSEFPQLEHVVRVRDGRKETLWVEEQQHTGRLLLVDADFLTMFSFQVLQGDRQTALGDPGAVVLTQSMAHRCFGDESAMGKEVRIATHYWQNEKQTFTVRGIVEDPPSNSSIQFGVLLPRTLIPPSRSMYSAHNPSENDAPELNFFVLSDYVFARLHDQAHVEDVNKNLDAFSETHQGTRMRRKVALEMQPLSDIHFDRRLTFNLEAPGNPHYAYILSGIALIVLLIACVNFMNLAIARFSTRVREVGVRKIVGAQRGQLMRQFWGESLVVTLFACVFGYALAEFFLPTFNHLTQTRLVMDYTMPSSIALFGVLLLIVVGLISGIYPAVLLSGLAPVTVLKDRLRLGGNGTLRRALVVLQFAASIFLIIATTLMFRQVDFLKAKDLGFVDEQIVAISTQNVRATGDFEKRRSERTRILSAFIQQLKNYSGIVGVTRSDLFENLDTDFTLNEVPLNLPGGSEIRVPYLDVDRDFANAMGIEIIAGRHFATKAGEEPQNTAVVNETLVKQLGLTAPLTFQLPLTRRIPIGNDFRKTRMLRNPDIIGVVKDFHVHSLHQATPPLILFVRENGIGGDILVRIHPEQTAQTLTFMGEQWRKITGLAAFDYVFLDARLDHLYQTEERWRTIVGYASTFALFVSCLGVLGLTAMAVVRRTKEFGIRKVLGATTQHIVTLLSKEFMILILVSNAIAWPVSYYAVNRWLQEFAYRIDMGVVPFLLSGSLVFMTALLTIGFHALRVARHNPVDALRYE